MPIGNNRIHFKYGELNKCLRHQIHHNPILTVDNLSISLVYPFTEMISCVLLCISYYKTTTTKQALFMLRYDIVWELTQKIECLSYKMHGLLFPFRQIPSPSSRSFQGQISVKGAPTYTTDSGLQLELSRHCHLEVALTIYLIDLLYRVISIKNNNC